MRRGMPFGIGRSDFRVGGAAQSGESRRKSSLSTSAMLLVLVGLLSFSCGRPVAAPPPPPPEAAAPPPPPPAPAVTLSASPDSIEQGEATTLEWSCPSPPIAHGNFETELKAYRGPYEYSVPGETSDFTPQTQS